MGGPKHLWKTACGYKFGATLAPVDLRDAACPSFTDVNCETCRGKRCGDHGVDHSDSSSDEEAAA